MSVENHGPLPDSNFYKGRQGQIIDRILLHTMVGWIASADARFHNPDAQVSAHFGIRVDGSLWQWVNVWDASFHSGDWQTNLQSIGLEHEDGGDYNGPRPDALYDRSAHLVAQFCTEYNIPCKRGTGGPGIYDHRQVHATACPDALDTDRIIRMASNILTPVVTPPVATPILSFVALPEAVKEWAQLYKMLSPQAGIKAEVALAQALHETGRFTFGGIAKASWNNPAGIGVTGSPDVGNRFRTKYDGVVAHLQHLLMYFTPAHTAFCTPLIDQRHYAHRGYPDDVGQLVGHWAVPGTNYDKAVLALVPEALTLLA